jgi:hypothetical protein
MGLFWVSLGSPRAIRHYLPINLDTSGMLRAAVVAVHQTRPPLSYSPSLPAIGPFKDRPTDGMLRVSTRARFGRLSLYIIHLFPSSFLAG